MCIEMAIDIGGSELKETLSVCVISSLIWGFFWLMSTFQSPEDNIYYWKIGYPILILVSGIAGYRAPLRPWRWSIYIIAIQFFLGMTTAKGGFNLLPIGILVYLLIALPCIAAGYTGAFINRRRKKNE